MANKQDIGELYGFEPTNPAVAGGLASKECPFTNRRCSMVLRGSPNPTGVCSLITAGKETIVCADRFYGGGYAVLKLAVNEVYGSLRWIAAPEARTTRGQFIVPREAVLMGGKGKLSFDWILHRYRDANGDGFIAADVLVPKFAGSYRDTLDGYRLHHTGKKTAIAPSGHTLNWDVEKAVDEIIRKSVLLRDDALRTSAYFIILTDAMFRKIEEFYEPVTSTLSRGADVISFRVYDTDTEMGAGVRHTRSVNIALDDLIVAYYGKADAKQVSKFKSLLGKMP